jgi:hypothetical protein
VRRTATFLLIALLCGAATSAAADAALEHPDLILYERWGALRARPRIQLLDVGWDTNVFNSAVETGDYRATFAPGLEGLVLFGDIAFLTFDSEARYTAYSSYDELNYLDLLNSGRLTFPLGRLGFFAGGQYDRVRKTPVDLNDVRPVYVTERIELGTIFEIDARSSIELSHNYWNLTHEDDDFDRREIDIGARLDRVEQENRLTFRNRIKGRTELSVEISDLEIEFDTPNLVGVPGFDRDSHAFRLLPGLSLGHGGPLVGRVEIGYAQLDYDSSLLPGYSGAVGRAELQYRSFRGMTWTLSGRRRVDFSASQGNNYYVLDGARLNTLYFLNPVIGLELELARGRLEFPVTNRVDDLTELLGGVRFRVMDNALGRRMEYRVKLGRRERESTEPIRDRSRAVLNFDAVFGY